MNRNKIRGMIVGGAIGDSWGMPVETWTPQRIKETYPDGVSKFIPPKNHKWFDPEKTPAGSTTDDTQLTIATMEGLINAQKNTNKTDSIYIDEIAKAHCKAYDVTTSGWGNTTREAVRRLANGVHWSLSGKTSETGRGTGNGVVMKCSPLAVCFWSDVFYYQPIHVDKLCVDYSIMTHNTAISAQATICHVNAVMFCLDSYPKNFSIAKFISAINEKHYDTSHLDQTTDNLMTRMNLLSQHQDNLSSMTQDEIINLFGPGSCYVYDSLPFSYAWFLKNPSFQILQQVVEAGGDTDTNAKMVGELLGALHGFEAIETYLPWAVKELIGIEELLKITDEFCDVFEIEQRSIT